MLGMSETTNEVEEPALQHVAGTEHSVNVEDLDCFSTGCVTLDLLFGGVSKKRRLGLAYGGWVTICGPSGHYKTILGCEIIDSAKRWAEQNKNWLRAQNKPTGVLAQVLDLEKTGFNVEYAESIHDGELPFGVEKNVEGKFTPFYEYTLSFIKECERLGKRGVLLIDSISTVVGDKQYDNTKTDEGSYGLEAYNAFDKHSIKLLDRCVIAGVTLIFITHTKLDMNPYSYKDYGEKMPAKLRYYRNHGLMLDKKIPLRNKNGDTIGNIVIALGTKSRNNRQDLMIPLVERTHYGIDERASCIAWLVRQKPYGGHDVLLNLFATGGIYPLGVNVKASITKEGREAAYAGQEIWDNLTQREVSNPGDSDLLEMHKALRRETIRVWMEKEDRIAQENGVGLKSLIPLSLDLDQD